MNQPQPQQRPVGVGLIIGIIFLPFVFAWLTLRPGHSGRARSWSFVWMGAWMTIMLTVATPADPEPSSTALPPAAVTVPEPAPDSESDAAVVADEAPITPEVLEAALKLEEKTWRVGRKQPSKDPVAVVAKRTGKTVDEVADAVDIVARHRQALAEKFQPTADDGYHGNVDVQSVERSKAGAFTAIGRVTYVVCPDDVGKRGVAAILDEDLRSDADRLAARAETVGIDALDVAVWILCRGDRRALDLKIKWSSATGEVVIE